MRAIGLTPLSFARAREAIGMKCRQDFNQNIRKHPHFQDALIKIGECTLNGSDRLTHFRLLYYAIRIGFLERIMQMTRHLETSTVSPAARHLRKVF
jgi:hypothetical protein